MSIMRHRELNAIKQSKTATEWNELFFPPEGRNDGKGNGQ